jgi:hypothetical protein
MLLDKTLEFLHLINMMLVSFKSTLSTGMPVMEEKLLAPSLPIWLVLGKFTDGVDGRIGLLPRDVVVHEKK